MTAVLHNQGRIGWSGTRDKDGHRQYKVVNEVRADPDDGPDVIMATPGLPLIGSYWNFGNGYDSWAFCKPDMIVSHYKPPSAGEPHKYWKVEQTFSTQPRTRCQDESIEDPLLEPQRVSGSFVKYSQQVCQDKDGNAIESSSHETIEGPKVEFDHNRPTVRIEQNVAALGLATFSSMVDTVNGSALWGLGTRRIKLSNVSWERRLHGICDYYYTRAFDFDIDFATFDRTVIDEGFMVLDPDLGGADKANPTHFVRYKDRNEENAGRVWLDGNGSASTSSTPTTIDIQYYGESNFLLLGIPTVF